MNSFNKLTIVLLAFPAVVIIAGLLFAFSLLVTLESNKTDDTSDSFFSSVRGFVSNNKLQEEVSLELAPFYAALELVEGNQTNSYEPIRGGIVPHHGLVYELIADFFQKISVGQAPKTIIVIGPNHDDEGASSAISGNIVWQTPIGKVETDEQVLSKLEQAGYVSRENEILASEHSVSTLLPFIEYYFPKAKVVPIILSSRHDLSESLGLASAISGLVDEETLVISSLDFSHYLSSDLAEQKDKLIYQAIENDDYETIMSLNSDYIDSPSSLVVLLEVMRILEATEDQALQHTNSGILFDTEVYESTSYYTIFFSQPSELIEVSLGGDVMVGRYIDTLMRNNGYDYPFTEIKYLFENSDIVFSNLESVISDHEVDSEKEIRFKANPEVVTELVEIGFTHFSVINNHVYDYGRAAWDQSIELLGEASLVPIGSLNNNSNIVYQEIDNTTFSYLAFDETMIPFDLSVAEGLVSQAAEQADVVFVSLHWGDEYSAEPNDYQVEIAHGLIDSGADVIVGHHPHVLQGIEKYNNGLIFYSFGNLVFDQIHRDDVNDSIIARIDFDGEDLVGVELIPIRIIDFKPRIAEPRYSGDILNYLAEISQADFNSQIRSGYLQF